MARSAEQIEVTRASRAAAGLPLAPAPVPVGMVSPFGTATPMPKLPPPNPYVPQPAATTGGTAPMFVAPTPTGTPVAVTGGNAPATTMFPTGGYNNGNGTVVQPQSPPPPVTAVTGGNAPATTMHPTATTGGNAPVNSAALITGTTAPPRVTGGNAPATPVATPAPPPATTPFPTINNPQQVYTPNMGAGNVVQDYLSQLLNDQSGYIQSARRSGIEQAAARGNINSSIAAGNSQRAAIDAAQPILNEITQLHNQREQLAFTGEQNQADRNQQITMAQINDWAANNQFNREYNGQLSLLPITSVTALNNQLMQAAIENPEIFPPEIVSGLGEFFGTNLLSMLQQWFPNQYGGGG